MAMLIFAGREIRERLLVVLDDARQLEGGDRLREGHAHLVAVAARDTRGEVGEVRGGPRFTIGGDFRARIRRGDFSRRLRDDIRRSHLDDELAGTRRVLRNQRAVFPRDIIRMPQWGEHGVGAQVGVKNERAVRPTSRGFLFRIRFEERAGSGVVAIILVAARVGRAALHPAKIKRVGELVPIEGERVARVEIHGGGILRLIELDPGPAARAAGNAAARDAGEHARERIAAEHEGRGRPVRLVADHLEAVVFMISHRARGVRHESIRDERRVGLDIVLPRDGAPARRGRIGHPCVEAQERIEIMPAPAVETLDRRVAWIAPPAVAPLEARFFKQRRQHRMLPAAEAPAIDIEHFQRADFARLVRIRVVIVEVIARVVDGDGALVVGLAIARDRRDERLQRRAIRRAIAGDLDVLQRSSARAGKCEGARCEHEYREAAFHGRKAIPRRTNEAMAFGKAGICGGRDLT